MPSPGAVANRRLLVSVVAAAGFVVFIFILLNPSRAHPPYTSAPIHHVEVSASTLHGDVIMPKLGNETAKAELGRASWKLLHTMMARYPEKPTADEQTALTSYVHLFARLYPWYVGVRACSLLLLLAVHAVEEQGMLTKGSGECAGHFRQILIKNPPQVSGRNAAAGWACHVHNEVNRSLKKEIFDCSKIGDFYDCGCAEEDELARKKGGTEELKQERS